MSEPWAVTPPLWTVIGGLPGTDTEEKADKGQLVASRRGKLSLRLGRVAVEWRPRGQTAGKNSR